MESWKIGNFAPKASESCLNFNISNVAVEMKLIYACEYFLVTEHRSKYTNTATLEYKNSKVKI